MIEKDILLFSVDGVLTQLDLARRVTEDDPTTTSALNAVIASVVTLRALIETEEEHQAILDGGCPHPKEKTTTQRMPDGSLLTMCTQCNEIIS